MPSFAQGQMNADSVVSGVFLRTRPQVDEFLTMSAVGAVVTIPIRV